MWLIRYIYDMKVYLGKQHENAACDVTAIHDIVLQMIVNKGHKLYIDNYFSSPWLFDNLSNRNIGFREKTSANFGPKYFKMKKGDTLSKVHGNAMATCWRNKTEVYMLSNVLFSSQWEFGDKHENETKHRIIEQYNTSSHK
jgi:hypothetical protein